MRGSRLLALGGLTASMLGTVGGLLAPSHPTLGPMLLGLGSLVMTVVNVVVLVGKRS